MCYTYYSFKAPIEQIEAAIVKNFDVGEISFPELVQWIFRQETEVWTEQDEGKRFSIDIYFGCSDFCELELCLYDTSESQYLDAHVSRVVRRLKDDYGIYAKAACTSN